MSWRDEAACRDVPDPAMFFPDEGWKTSATKAALIGQAKQICARCPVTQACLDDAVRFSAWEDHGIRAGMTEDERRQSRRDRGQTVGLSASEKRAAS